MIIKDEISLREFDAWAKGRENLDKLTDEEKDRLEAIMSDMYPDGMSATELNDLLWFDFETVCDWLGLEYDSDEDEIVRD